jgi:hypothetical protein
MQVQIVEKPLKYGSRRYDIGQLVEMTDKHARLFMAIGRVGLPRSPRPDIPASPSLPVTNVTETVPPADEIEATRQEFFDKHVGAPSPAERTRRQYRRRDIRPENRDPQAED